MTDDTVDPGATAPAAPDEYGFVDQLLVAVGLVAREDVDPAFAEATQGARAALLGAGYPPEQISALDGQGVLDLLREHARAQEQGRDLAAGEQPASDEALQVAAAAQLGGGQFRVESDGSVTILDADGDVHTTIPVDGPVPSARDTLWRVSLGIDASAPAPSQSTVQALEAAMLGGGTFRGKPDGTVEIVGSDGKVLMEIDPGAETNPREALFRSYLDASEAERALSPEDLDAVQAAIENGGSAGVAEDGSLEFKDEDGEVVVRVAPGEQVDTDEVADRVRLGIPSDQPLPPQEVLDEADRVAEELGARVEVDEDGQVVVVDADGNVLARFAPEEHDGVGVPVDDLLDEGQSVEPDEGPSVPSEDAQSVEPDPALPDELLGDPEPTGPDLPDDEMSVEPPVDPGAAAPDVDDPGGMDLGEDLLDDLGGQGDPDDAGGAGGLGDFGDLGDPGDLDDLTELGDLGGGGGVTDPMWGDADRGLGPVGDGAGGSTSGAGGTDPDGTQSASPGSSDAGSGWFDTNAGDDFGGFDGGAFDEGAADPATTPGASTQPGPPGEQAPTSPAPGAPGPGDTPTPTPGGEGDGDFGFEMDMSGVEVTDAEPSGAGDGDFGFEIDQSGVRVSDEQTAPGSSGGSPDQPGSAPDASFDTGGQTPIDGDYTPSEGYGVVDPDGQSTPGGYNPEDEPGDTGAGNDSMSAQDHLDAAEVHEEAAARIDAGLDEGTAEDAQRHRDEAAEHREAADGKGQGTDSSGGDQGSGTDSSGDDGSGDDSDDDSGDDSDDDSGDDSDDDSADDSDDDSGDDASGQGDGSGDAGEDDVEYTPDPEGTPPPPPLTAAEVRQMLDDMVAAKQGELINYGPEGSAVVVDRTGSPTGKLDGIKPVLPPDDETPRRTDGPVPGDVPPRGGGYTDPPDDAVTGPQQMGPTEDPFDRTPGLKGMTPPGSQTGTESDDDVVEIPLRSTDLRFAAGRGAQLPDRRVDDGSTPDEPTVRTVRSTPTPEPRQPEGAGELAFGVGRLPSTPPVEAPDASTPIDIDPDLDFGHGAPELPAPIITGGLDDEFERADGPDIVADLGPRVDVDPPVFGAGLDGDDDGTSVSAPVQSATFGLRPPVRSEAEEAADDIEFVHPDDDDLFDLD
ncbi:MAG: hypothetical protein MUF83_17325 [Acidimicrobiales bacterium]|jgi:hypothetical protein|nr:hypothetical protein [Acidimicrobiales bacterium]